MLLRILSTVGVRLAFGLTCALAWTSVMAAPGTKADVQAMLTAFDRPTPAGLRRVPWAEIEAVVGQVPLPTEAEKNTFALFAAVIEEMRASYPDSLVLVFGRDGEFFYDAFSAVARPSERARLQLVQASRGLVKNSQPDDLVKFLRGHKVRPEEIFAGKQKVLMLDTGSRGQIFGRLLGLLTSLIPENDPERFNKLMNLYENVEGRLIVALGQPSKNNILAFVKGALRRNQEIAEKVMADLYYPHIPSSGREQFGLGKTFEVEFRWLVDNVEHTPKWRARTSLVDAAGKVSLVPDPKDQGDINPLTHMVYQLKVMRHFLGNQPWLIDEAEEKSVEHLEAIPAAVEAVRSAPELYARMETLLEERKGAADDRKKAIGEELGRLLRSQELQDMVIRLKMSSDSFAHIVRRNVEDFPPDFLKKYAAAARLLKEPSEKQQRALLKCSERLYKLGLEAR